MTGNELEAQVNALELKLGQLRGAIEGLAQELARHHPVWLPEAVTAPERWAMNEREEPRGAPRALWQERVINEREQLTERLDRLETFLASQQCQLLPVPEQVLLQAQAKAMTGYLSILTKRVDRFPPTE